jgi:cytochrome c oxidase cbb3-type subunit 3
MNAMMADLPSGFWAGWIAVITIVSLMGLCWLIFSVYFSATGEEESPQPVWDENLREGNNPAPMWWFWLILGLLVFSLIYLILYPGIGSYQGALKWSQGGRLNQSYAKYEDEFSSLRQLVTEASIETLARDTKIMASARRIFDQNCAACHGAEGKGQASLFPNLIDDAWQWGSSPAQIEQSIRLGRQAAMPGWLAVAGDQGVQQLAQYVLAASRGEAIPEADPGKTLYSQFCVGCHGTEGKGNAALGASDLTSGTWLYGSAEQDVAHSIGVGRNGIMPAFQERLDDTQIRMLVAWLSREKA